VLGLFYA